MKYKEREWIYLSGSLSAVGRPCLTPVVCVASLPATPGSFSFSAEGLVGTVQSPAQVAVSVVLLLSLHPFLWLEHHRLVTLAGGLEFVFAVPCLVSLCPICQLSARQVTGSVVYQKLKVVTGGLHCTSQLALFMCSKSATETGHEYVYFALNSHTIMIRRL